jgi:excisionase family DNA binding protein
MGDKKVESNLLTKEETLEYLRISKTTLEYLIKEEGLPFIKWRRKLLFRKSDLDKFLDQSVQSLVGDEPDIKKISED